MQRGEFVLAFQPQLSMVTGEVVGAEALLRWNHPRDGLRLPTTFIPIAERSGVISRDRRLGDAEVAATLGAWNRDGMARRLAFNVSPRQLERADFFARLRQAFEDHGVPLSLVELEFTETAAMEVSESMIAEIAALRADGARIAIDDFGTGYSNLARLRTMPLDRVKLDPSLIVDIEEVGEGAGDRPGGDAADPRRRLRNRRRSRRDRRAGRILRAMGCETSRATSSPIRCSRTSILRGRGMRLPHAS